MTRNAHYRGEYNNNNNNNNGDDDNDNNNDNDNQNDARLHKWNFVNSYNNYSVVLQTVL